MPAPSRVGVYPGTFDPVTNGHLDIIRRGAKLVDRLVVSPARNIGKSPMFSVDERAAMVRAEAAAIAAAPGAPDCEIVVVPFDTLLMRFVEEQGARFIVRGLRAVSDFEYEFQMVGMNRRMNQEVETLFLMSSENCQFISSRLVKEIARLGGAIHEFVPPRVETRMRAAIAREAAEG